MITMRAFEILHFFMNEFDVGPSVATLCECLITQRTWKTSNAEMHYSYVCFDVSSIVTVGNHDEDTSCPLFCCEFYPCARLTVSSGELRIRRLDILSPSL